jgi:hypothetical protein
MTEREPEGLALPLVWRVPEDISTRYATNLVVQHSEHEFIISFFEAIPPLLIGEPAEIRAELEKLGDIEARCVARVVVAAKRMPEFVRVLQQNLEKYLSTSGDSE